MTDLERLFGQLVTNLAATDPARLNRPIALGEIQQSIVPYRIYRRALGIDSVEDYDLVLLRLAAGDGGFARTEPHDVQARFQAELASPNPDLTLLQRHADALVTLEGLRVARALASEADAPFAPPEPPPEPEAGLGPAPVPYAATEVAVMCLYCGTTLPSGRQVNFCPSCGQSQTTPRCPQCQSEVELGWRHCVACGAALPTV
ncbi:MAG TPA: zinc ribbon domain-containing protein [Gemmatimonadales bacterium]|nr:zinc ribbon domain-containing protein [Gemmatimonadales bacterium]